MLPRINTDTHTHTYTHTHTHTHMYMCMCMCMYIYMYIYIRGSMNQSISQFRNISMYHWVSCILTPLRPPNMGPPQSSISPNIKLITVLSLTVLDTLILNKYEWHTHFSMWLCLQKHTMCSGNNNKLFTIYDVTINTVTSQSQIQMVDMAITFLLTWQTPDEIAERTNPPVEIVTHITSL